ncbi:MAG TPA: hypothetical protein VGH23_10310 [Rhizomicrobium sp.]
MRKAQAILLLMFLPLPALAQVQTTIAPPALPSLDAQSNQGSATDPDATYCRPPQRRTDSALMGPRVCMTNKQWADLHASGFDIGPDGAKVSMEKHVNMLSH